MQLIDESGLGFRYEKNLEALYNIKPQVVLLSMEASHLPMPSSPSHLNVDQVKIHRPSDIQGSSRPNIHKTLELGNSC